MHLFRRTKVQKLVREMGWIKNLNTFELPESKQNNFKVSFDQKKIK